MDLVERVKAILASPKMEWRTIADEPGDPAYLFANYVAVLAAIPAVCGFLGAAIFSSRLGVGRAFFYAIVFYVLSFVIVYVAGLIADALAPSFGGRKSQPGALKLVVYSMTPAWLAGVFLLIPGLRFLTILGLYAFYLFWVGAPALMKTPNDKAAPYTAATAICAIVIFVVVILIVKAVGVAP